MLNLSSGTVTIIFVSFVDISQCFLVQQKGSCTCSSISEQIIISNSPVGKGVGFEHQVG